MKHFLVSGVGGVAIGVLGGGLESEALSWAFVIVASTIWGFACAIWSMR